MNYTDEKEPASPTKEYAIDEKASASASIVRSLPVFFLSTT